MLLANELKNAPGAMGNELGKIESVSDTTKDLSIQVGLDMNEG